MFNKCVLLICFIFLNQALFSQFQSYQVNNPSSTRPEEVTIAINPAEPNIIAAGANIDYFYLSTDYGITWSEKSLTSSLGVYGDPCVLFDDSGNLYFAHLSNPQSGGYWIDRIVVQKSTDNGQNWNDGAGVGLTAPKNQDKEWMAVDLVSSEYWNNVYMSWTEFDDYGSSNPADSTRIIFSRSTDFGETWSQPIRVSDHGGNCIDSDETVEGAVPTVGPNGEVYVSWSGPVGIMFDKSTDGGKTFGKDVFVNRHIGGWDFSIPGIYRCNGMPVTACDVSNSIYKGNIYIMWGELAPKSENAEVYISRSTDNGNTWTSKIKVNDDNTKRHQFFPWMSVDPQTGYIYVVFYDRRNTSGNETEVYLARSTNGGESFQNYLVSKKPFTPEEGIFFGDYINIAAYDGNIYPIWTEYSSGKLSVWVSPIKDSSLVTSIEEDPKLINKFGLFQNYPNPFNPSTTISYELPHSSYVTLSVYNGLGELNSVLVKGYMSEGIHEVTFEPQELASGLYFYRINADGFNDVKKMLFLK